MSGVRWARVARAFRRVALPLASYYAVTLALPLEAMTKQICA